MEFSNRLYNLRKQSGFSQEELGNKLNVSRQTVSKWEVGDTNPDMERLVMLSDLFQVSLDELILGIKPEKIRDQDMKSSMMTVITEKISRKDNKQKIKKILKVFGIILGILFVVDIISMVIFFIVNGIPQ
jgi:transcriptional regulator with XRE-family HTH domain